MKPKIKRQGKALLAALLCAASVLAAALCIGAQRTVAAPVVWNGAPDRAVAAEIPAVRSTTRQNASGAKIPSNAHSADFPGIYFIWDSKQKDNGYLKVEAALFGVGGSFTLTAKESGAYWDFEIAPQAGQAQTGDGCYVFFIPKVCGNKNINMVFVEGLPPPETTTAAPSYSVVTGDWQSYGNYLAYAQGSYAGGFGSPVARAGILYAYEDPGLAAPMAALAGAADPAFGALLTGLANGTWYYAAFVKTLDGNTFYGEVKMAAYP